MLGIPTREQTTRQSTYNWVVLSEAWAGGNKWYTDSDVAYDTVSFDNFARGSVLKQSWWQHVLISRNGSST